MRISHDTNDGTSKSPDAPVSDEGQQPISEPATPSDAASSSRSDFVVDRGAPQSHYLDSNQDLGMVGHGGSSAYHHQLSPRQDYYHQGGHQYTTYDQYTGYSNVSETAGLQADWNPYYHDQGTDQDMVDPALRGGPMPDQPSPLHNDYPNHSTYNPWMPAAQHWGN